VAQPLDPETIFCQEYARSGDALDAIITAGITNEDGAPVQFPKRILADRLLQRADIQAAIKAIRAMDAAVEQVEITHRSVAADMESVYAAAMKKEDFKAAISAKTLQSNVLGLLEQKIHITSHKTVDEMTTAELAAIAFKGRLLDATPKKEKEDAEAELHNPE
jgi:hypothetical protein